jgi:uncharacterized membrane protein
MDINIDLDKYVGLIKDFYERHTIPCLVGCVSFIIIIFILPKSLFMNIIVGIILMLCITAFIFIKRTEYKDRIDTLEQENEDLKNNINNKKDN